MLPHRTAITPLAPSEAQETILDFARRVQKLESAQAKRAEFLAVLLKLDRALRDNVWLIGEPKVESLFPLFSGENISGIALENIALDGGTYSYNAPAPWNLGLAGTCWHNTVTVDGRAQM